eukprot:1881385-Pyramimonas_sp.AAC.1
MNIWIKYAMLTLVAMSAEATGTPNNPSIESPPGGGRNTTLYFSPQAALHGLDQASMLACPHAKVNGKAYYSCSHLAPGHLPVVPIAREFTLCEDYRNCVKRLSSRAFRTIWFLGDSMSAEFAVALRCLFYQTTYEAGIVSRIFPDRAGKRFSGLTAVTKHSCVKFTALRLSVCNIKITPYFSSSRFKCGDGLKCLSKLLQPKDRVVVNFGMWYNSRDNERLEKDIRVFNARLRVMRR